MATIYNHSGKLNEDDRIALPWLLFKAGHRVRPGKEQLEGRKSNTLYVEFDLKKENEDER